MDSRSVGVLLLVVAVVVAVIGLAVLAGLLNWFGRLPGDIRIDRGNVRVYVPIVSMLLISVALSIALAVFNRLR
jgi:hypothetical protein